jgi:UDP-N-acetylmuramate dehydrogenase
LNLLQNIPLAPYTTFRIGGPARWFVEALSEDDVAAAVAWAHTRRVPLFILGGGSNLLVSDNGFDGLVVRIALHGIATPDPGIYQAAAGEDWNAFVQRTLDDNCAGIECLAGIPGTVGGTPVQNVGAYGQEVSSAILRVRAYDLREHSFVSLPSTDCGFEYRRTRFNAEDYGRFIVTRVDYVLTPGGPPTLRYTDLQHAFEWHASAPTLSEVAAAVRRIRHSKGMLLVEGDPDSRSAGSFFKNPIISEDLFENIAARSAAPPPRFLADTGKVKIPAAWLIEQAGFAKGYARGAAAISTRHTLALTNRSTATAAEILALAAEIAAAVKAKFSVDLEMEPVQIGF